ncbi:unnamed protein product [Ostreobium quekettii]|uniref:Large ribosomal subunit protein uL3c n=1 Tax=Ostreobium quekettii TaxID=121088 RepID=A0A8S1IU51_9CHLO|nr:unnamed protein product [Ostreobium quekettii]|eukprot:evm.model.scf_1277.1 EVM.evm.TU.scf_1277.1   scf_1277:7832-11156(-)
MAGFQPTAPPARALGSAHSAMMASFQNLRLSPAGGRSRAAPGPVVARAPEAGVGMMGTKVAMRTFFTEEGLAYGATIIGFEPGNVVSQVKTKASDGYEAVQVAYRGAKEKSVKAPVRGHLKKHGVEPMKHIREWRLTDPEVVAKYEPGQQLDVNEIFKVGEVVDVAGKTIGKGFQGAIKRWHHKRGLMTHGSKSKREHGSIGGGSATPSRVFPGMKMAGHMGNVRRKMKRLEILEIDPEGEYIVVKGAVPGKRGNVLQISPSKIVGVNC